MLLERGKKYKHTTGSGTNICIYSHSDELDYNHFFKVSKNRKKWKLDDLGQVSLPTWDVQRNMSAV